jgi:hypothetical protein
MSSAQLATVALADGAARRVFARAGSSPAAMKRQFAGKEKAS